MNLQNLYPVSYTEWSHISSISVFYFHFLEIILLNGSFLKKISTLIRHMAVLARLKSQTSSPKQLLGGEEYTGAVRPENRMSAKKTARASVGR